MKNVLLQSSKQTFTYDRYGNRNFDESNTTRLPKNCGTSPNFTVCAADRKVVNPEIVASNNRIKGDQDGDGINDYTFDASGNTTHDAQVRTFIYDAENKQVEVRDSQQNVIGQYHYDGDGKRVKKVVPGTGELTIFVYDAAGKLVAEYSTVIAPPSEAKVSYLTNDHLGSPRINTDQNGSVTARHDYHPFGEEITGTGGRTQGLNYTADDVRKQFTGYERDSEADLDYAQARYYSNQHGRFTSTDPIVLTKERLLDPQRVSLYSYCRNSPLVFTDSLGLDIDFADTKAGRRARKAFAAYEKYLEKNKDKDGFSELIATVQGLKDSEVTYEITFGGSYNDGVEGSLTSDGERVFVNVSGEGDERYSQYSRFAHELEHARQFDNGELAFVRNDTGRYGPSPSSYDIGDEVKAFRAQLIASSVQDFQGKGGTFLRTFQNARTDDNQADVVARQSPNYQKIRSRGFDRHPRFDSSSGYKVGQLIRPTNQNGFFFGRIRTVFERQR